MKTGLIAAMDLESEWILRVRLIQRMVRLPHSYIVLASYCYGA